VPLRAVIEASIDGIGEVDAYLLCMGLISIDIVEKRAEGRFTSMYLYLRMPFMASGALFVDIVRVRIGGGS